MYKIEKGIPIPTKSPRDLYNFRSMAVGDSFLLPSTVAQKVRMAATHFTKRSKGEYKYTVRIVDDKNHRCWRTS